MLRTWPAIGLAAFLCLACQPTGPVVGGTPPPKPVRTVASLSPSTTEIVAEARGPIELVGRTANDNYPPGLERTEIVVPGTKPDYEKLAKIKPDLVLYDAKLYSQSDIAKIEQLGLKTLALDVDTIDEYIDYVHRLGAMVGAESAMSKQADGIYSARARAQAAASDNKPRVAVLTERGGGEYMVAGTKSFVADVVKASGGTPVGPDSDRFETASVEALIAQAPEAIFTSAKGTEVLKDPRLATLPAVKNRRVYQVNPDVLLRTSPRMRLLIDSMSNALQLTKSEGGA